MLKINYNAALSFFIASPHEIMNPKKKLSNKTRPNSLKVILIYFEILTLQHLICAPLLAQKLVFFTAQPMLCSGVILQIKANSAILVHF